MSLRINLLPEYVRLQRNFKRITAFCVALFVATATVLFLLYYKRQQELATLIVNRDNIEPIALKAEAAQSAANAARTASLPKRSAINFIVDSSRTGPQRAALLDLVSHYVYGGTVVTSLDLSDGQNVRIRSSVRNPDEYARFLTNLRRGSDAKGGPLFRGLPVSSGVPGFPPPRPAEGDANQNQPQPGQQPGPLTPSQPAIVVFPLTIDTNAVLLHPVQLPPDPTTVPAAAEGDPADPTQMIEPDPAAPG